MNNKGPSSTISTDTEFHHFFILIAIVLAVLAVVVIAIKVSMAHHPINKSTNVEALSPAEVLKEIRAEKADLDREKAEIQQMITEGKSAIIAASLSSNIDIQWRTTGLNVNGPDNKPVMVGFRQDGLLSWKLQQ